MLTYIKHQINRKKKGTPTLISITIILIISVSLIFVFGDTVLKGVLDQLDVVVGEITSADAIYRDDVLHIRINFKHTTGTTIDKIYIYLIL